MYEGKSILELHELLVSKKVTPLDLAKDAIELAKKDTNNAFEYIMEDEALAFASSLGEPEVDNPLWGIPFVIKDNFSTKDVPTTGSSNILNGYVPVYDATIIAKLKENVDTLIVIPNDKLLEIISAYSSAYAFKAVVPLSAKTGDGILTAVQLMCAMVKNNKTLTELAQLDKDV